MWFPGLHVIRGIAALMVVILHAYWTWPLAFNPFVRNLYLCVDLFFILSGFVICLRYESFLNNISDFSSFIKKRFFRLAKVYYLSGAVWLIAFCVFYAAKKDPISLHDISLSSFRYVFALDFLYEDGIFKANPIAWSIMVEVWTYFIFALSFLAVKNRHLRILMAMAISGVALITFESSNSSFNVVSGMGALVRCIAGFYTGVLICLVHLAYKEKGLVWLAGFFALMFGAMVLLQFQTDIKVFLLFCLIIVFLVRFNSYITAPQRGMMFLGDISYSLYLWHFIFSVIFAKILHAVVGASQFIQHDGESFLSLPTLAGSIGLLAYMAIAILIANFSYEKLEKK